MKKRYILLFTLGVLFLSVIGYIKYHQMNINDIGLSVLSLVKKVKGDSVDFTSLGTTNTPIMKHDKWNVLTQVHVSKSGEVNYKGFLANRLQFEVYLDELSAHPPGKNWTQNEQLAYWINAYNAFTVKLIIDHYPLNSIKDIGGGSAVSNSPWNLKFFKIDGIDFDLNTIEHEILRKHYEEPRIHFAINCASFSCPILRNEAYTAAQLESQLEDQTRLFLFDPSKNIISEKETKLSSILNWFASDFKVHGDVMSFIKKYNSALNLSNEVQYLEYKWNLNE